MTKPTNEPRRQRSDSYSGIVQRAKAAERARDQAEVLLDNTPGAQKLNRTGRAAALALLKSIPGAPTASDLLLIVMYAAAEDEAARLSRLGPKAKQQDVHQCANLRRSILRDLGHRTKDRTAALPFEPEVGITPAQATKVPGGMVVDWEQEAQRLGLRP
jgi:hypothetical protein